MLEAAARLGKGRRVGFVFEVDRVKLLGGELARGSVFKFEKAKGKVSEKLNKKRRGKWFEKKRKI